MTAGDTPPDEPPAAPARRYRGRVSSEEWAPPCALCPEPSIEELPMVRPTLDAEQRPGVPLCIEHRRMVVAGVARVGFCQAGRHYSHHMDYCQEHNQLMIAP